MIASSRPRAKAITSVMQEQEEVFSAVQRQLKTLYRATLIIGPFGRVSVILRRAKSVTSRRWCEISGWPLPNLATQTDRRTGSISRDAKCPCTVNPEGVHP